MEPIPKAQKHEAQGTTRQYVLTHIQVSHGVVFF